jgi:hypothetical protein
MLEKTKERFGGRVLRVVASVAILATGILAALFFIEGVPAQVFTPRAEAWSCSVTLSQVNDNATLSWSVSSDIDYVTIDGMSGQFATSGSLPATAGATYIVRLHLNGVSNAVGGCGTDGSWFGPQCSSQTLSLNDNTFTWSGPAGVLEYYQGELCDGTIIPRVNGRWVGNTVSIPLASRIKTLTACGSGCTKTATQSCPTPPAPTCSMSANPTSITQGASSVISWTTANVASASFNNGITSTATSGSATMSPQTTTTYTGTFVGTNGNTISCSATVQVSSTPPPPNAPTCSLSISPSRVSSGGSATLSWSTTNASSFSLDQGIGSVATTSGSRDLTTITEAKTYTGTVTNASGNTATCSASVSLESGGGGGGGGSTGGGCLNCGSKKKETTPTIVLDKETTYPGGFITLTELPYTGFDAGPLATILFWVGLLGVSYVVAYLSTHVSMSSFALAFVHHPKEKKGVPLAEEPVPFAEEVRDIVQKTTATLSSLVGLHAREDGSLALRIEEDAHAQNILLAPEAITLVTEKIQKSGGATEAFLKKFFARALEQYPLDEGWLLLSLSRTKSVLDACEMAEGVAPAPISHVSTPTSATAPLATEVPTTNTPVVEKRELPTHNRFQNAQATGQFPISSTPATPAKTREGATTSSVEEVARAILGGNRAFVDASVAKGISLLSVVDALDTAYRARRTGTETPLTGALSRYSDTEVETLLGLLVDCLHHGYHDEKTGVRVHLEKVFAIVR